MSAIQAISADAFRCFEDTDEWAGQFATIVNPEVTHIQWCHAILGDRTFKSPWSACEDALALAFDLHLDSFVQAYDTVIWMPYGLHHHRFRAQKNPKLHVQFADAAEFFCGFEDSASWSVNQFPLTCSPSCRQHEEAICFRNPARLEWPDAVRAVEAQLDDSGQPFDGHPHTPQR